MIVFLLGYFSAAKYVLPFATTNLLLERKGKHDNASPRLIMKTGAEVGSWLLALTLRPRVLSCLGRV